jgi:hypothetical protein
MQARAQMPSAEHPNHTVAHVVDSKTNEIVEAARGG